MNREIALVIGLAFIALAWLLRDRLVGRGTERALRSEKPSVLTFPNLALHGKLSAWREHMGARSTVADTAPELLDWPVSQIG